MKKNISDVNKLKVDHVYQQFHVNGETVYALEDIDLCVKEGEFVSIVGESGCGKSTLLKIISGLQKPIKGSIFIDDVKVDKPGIQCGMVFQESRLFPWHSVRKNVEFGISAKLPPDVRQAKVQKYIDLVGLTGFENAYPGQLSGGMQQRVSIARALINEPQLLLLDEPFGALDAFTRISMQNEVLRIQQASGTTMMLVTHDIDEAIYLSDRIFIFSKRPGKLKRTVEIEMGTVRDRSSDEFGLLRRSILKEFLEESYPEAEYMI